MLRLLAILTSLNFSNSLRTLQSYNWDFYAVSEKLVSREESEKKGKKKKRKENKANANEYTKRMNYDKWSGAFNLILI